MASRGDTTPTVSRFGPTSQGGTRGRVLILGGTADGRRLADLLSEAGYSPVTSLAGVTSRPGKIRGETRVGAFGGADGLGRYLTAERIFCLVDATHPFAVVISHHASAAARSCKLPWVRLERPAWRPEAKDRWIEVKDIEAAVAVTPSGARILLTIGRKEVLPFLMRADISGIARMIEPPDIEVTSNWRILLDRPPFHVEKEMCLLRDHSVTHLVTKNAGGEEASAKLKAARMRDIPVIMIQRPGKPEAVTVDDPLAILAFLDNIVSA